MEQNLKNMDYIFHPRSIAFVGASETLPKWGFIVFNNLISGGYEGKLYPVNPGRDKILDHKAYPSVRDIPDEVDLAIFSIPANQVLAAVDDCVAKGVKAGVVISAGFKEKGGEFADMEAELVSRARAGNMVLVGPNCNGISCPEEKLFPLFSSEVVPPGNVAIVSQSGYITDILTRMVVNTGFSVSKTVSSGNEAYLKSEDYYTYFSEDPTVDVIVSYVEGISDGRRFIEKTRAAASKKPIVIFKGGRTETGISAAGSHTGALAVRNEIFESACKQAGVILARDIMEAGILAVSFIDRPLPRGRRVAILTGAGGFGVISSDLCSDEGLDVVRLSDETLTKIDNMMPDWWVPGNPVDFVAGFGHLNIIPIMEVLMKSGEIDAIISFMGVPFRRDKDKDKDKEKKTVDIFKNMKGVAKLFETFEDTLYDMMHEYNVPIYAPSSWRPLSKDDKQSEKHINKYPSVETACRAVSVMADYYERKVSR